MAQSQGLSTNPGLSPLKTWWETRGREPGTAAELQAPGPAQRPQAQVEE